MTWWFWHSDSELWKWWSSSWSYLVTKMWFLLTVSVHVCICSLKNVKEWSKNTRPWLMKKWRKASWMWRVNWLRFRWDKNYCNVDPTKYTVLIQLYIISFSDRSWLKKHTKKKTVDHLSEACSDYAAYYFHQSKWKVYSLLKSFDRLETTIPVCILRLFKRSFFFYFLQLLRWFLLAGYLLWENSFHCALSAPFY